MSELILKPIGFIESVRQQKSAAGRQPITNGGTSSLDRLRLIKEQGFEQALEDLAGFSHLWLIFHFDQAKGWKPKVKPPRGIDRKVGVFASRSPYRPNPIGLSLVRLLEIRGRDLLLNETDLLDGTPVFDIKPYVASSDSVTESLSGWMSFLEDKAYQFVFSPVARTQLEFVEELGLHLRGILQKQLERDPLNQSSKRVREISEGIYQYAYRLWRVDFRITDNQQILIELISHVFHNDVDEKLRARLSPAEIDAYQKFTKRFPAV